MNIVEERDAPGVVLSGFPDTLEGRHARWYWEMLQSRAEGLTDDEVAEHFGADSVKGIAIQGGGSAAAALRIVATRGPFASAAIEAIRAGSTSLSIVYRTAAGAVMEEHLEFEPDGSRKITMRTRRLPGGGSATALFVAEWRAAHHAVDGACVLDDHLAHKLVDADLAIEFTRRDPRARNGRIMLAARSRIAEDTFWAARRDGIYQYVLLGAGMDTFAYRHAEEDGLRVFEVDHPSSQQWKRERLAEAHIAEPPTVAYVPVDFTRDDLDGRLGEADFDAGRPAVVAWLGVVYYLDREAIIATLDRIAGWAPGTRLVLDYFIPQRCWDEFPDWTQQFRLTAQQVALSGEPWLSYFSPEEMGALLEAHGFRDVEHFDADRVRTTYLDGSTELPIDPIMRVTRATV